MEKAPVFLEKASVFLGYGFHSLSPGSVALGGWVLWMLCILAHDRSAGAGC